MALSSAAPVDYSQYAREDSVMLEWRHTRSVVNGLLLSLCMLMGCGEEKPPSPVVPDTPVPQTADPKAPSTPPTETNDADAFPPLETSPQNDSRDTPPTQAAHADPSATSGANLNRRQRLPDDRPSINELRLQEAGISRYESRRLVLLSDIPEDRVAEFPQMADSLFAALEKHFGKLSKAIDGSEFQVTGHLIEDEARFRAAGLMPSTTFTFEHGRHLNYQFWMFNPEDDYYRRHLLFHEFIHCFMTCESGMRDIPPLWYIEGMAEFFATHQTPRDDNQSIEFGILPNSFDGFEGWGRISELRRSFTQASDSATDSLKLASFADVTPKTVASFNSNAQYAESWGVCWLIHSHPEYRRAFGALAQQRTRSEFLSAFDEVDEEVKHRLAVDWLLVREELREGFDTKLSFPTHATARTRLSDAATQISFQLSAQRGWQDTGIRVSKGESISIEATGRYQVNSAPKPWISEPQGVSIEYFRDRPLGQIIAVFVDTEGKAISRTFTVGRTATLTAPIDGVIWLQINDRCDSRHNNDGAANLTIKQK